MNDEKLCRIALNTAPQIGPVTHHRLVAAFGAASQVFKAGLSDLARVEGVSNKTAALIKEMDPISVGAREADLAGRGGATIFVLGEEGYPPPLVNAYSPPPVIYISGEWREEDTAAIAIVGSRAPTRYGKVMTEKFATELAKNGVTIVSGLARGVDGIAHRSAITAGGRTMAVLGCGLNIFYPAEHRELQKKIPAHGAVISQFPYTARPDKIFFPMRNRVISGLSLGTFITEKRRADHRLRRAG